MNQRLYLIFVILFLLLSKRAAAQASLVGTTEGLVRQNQLADAFGMDRVKSESELEEMKAQEKILPIPDTVRVDHRLAEKWRLVLPTTAYFLGDLGIEFKEIFGKKLQVNSAVRTEARQLEIILKEKNPNAAPVRGKRRSLHLTGSTVDIAKVGLTDNELSWLRSRLLELESSGLIDATEEKKRLVFHVMVFSTYTGLTQYAN